MAITAESWPETRSQPVSSNGIDAHRRDTTMTTHHTYETNAAPAAPATARWPLILAAVGFLVLYLGTDFVTSALASAPLPLPDAPAETARAWFADNQLAAVTIGVFQFLSVACLAVFVTWLRRTATTARQAAAAAVASRFGLGAVALMMLASVFAWLLATLAPSASLDAVSVLRTANFIAGGTAHVLALGLFVLLASRIPGFGKGVRVFGYVAAVPAVLSVVSLGWSQGAALILLGRLLCMIWTICAGLSVTRRLSRGTWA
jgi:hypothetical protein